MEELTERQKQVLAIIMSFIKQGKPFPSLREIAEQLGVRNKSGITGHINALERKGYIQRRSQRVSDFSLTGELAAEVQSFALVATIPAGIPQSTYDQSGEQLTFNQGYFGGGDLKAVTICGESMAGDAICDGDIAIIRMQKEASSQDIVAVRVDQDEVTLKRIRYHDQSVDLVPSNPAYSVRKVPAEQVEVIGKLVGIVRKA